jgi:hypothetical protein
VQPDRGRPPLAAASLGRSALPAPAWNGTQATSAPDGACAWAARDRRMTREFGEKTNRGRVELWSCGAVELVLRKQCNEGSLPLFCSHGPSGALRATRRVWALVGRSQVEETCWDCATPVVTPHAKPHQRQARHSGFPRPIDRRPSKDYSFIRDPTVEHSPAALSQKYSNQNCLAIAATSLRPSI